MSKKKEDSWSDDEFMTLLNDFIKNDCEEEHEAVPASASKPKKKSAMRRYRRRGHTYLAPASIERPRWTFSLMDAFYDSASVNLYDENPRFYQFPWPHIPEDFSLLFQGVERKVEVEDDVVKVWLYRVGESKPLFCQTAPALDESDWLIQLDEYINDLTPGSYFLLFDGFAPGRDVWKGDDSLGGHFCFDFRMLMDGSELEHPAPDSLAPELVASDDGKQQVLHLHPHYAAQPDGKDELVFYCFTRSWWLMGQGDASIASDYAWMSGDYLLVAVHNGEPFRAFPFTLADGKVETGEAYDIRPTSREYLLMKLPQLKHPAWKSLSIHPRWGGIARRAMESFRLEAFNEMRSSANMKTVSTYEHYLLAVADYKVADHFANLASGCSSVRYVDAGTWLDNYQRQAMAGQAEDLFDDVWQCAICLYNIGVLSTGEGQPFVRRLIDKMEKKTGWSLFICGSQSQLNALLECVPALQRFFPAGNRLTEEEPTAMQLMHYLQYRIGKDEFRLTAQARQKLVRFFEEAAGNGMLRNWGAQELDDYFVRLRAHCIERALATDSREKAANVLFLVEEDVEPPIQSSTTGAAFDDCMRGLDRLVGLDNLKQRLKTVFNRVRFDEMRQRAGLHVEGKGMSHMVFTGSPGTGKTTVARLMGQACRALGILSKGEVVVTERSRLVGRYIGDTERNTLAVLESARGNVLFIDEAYNLFVGGDDSRDFGMRVIDTLLTVLSAPNPDMLVIMAGYEKEMDRLLASNPGLRGRFSCTLHFEDYTADELMQIALNRLEEQDYRLTEEARHTLLAAVRKAVAEKDRYFGNARWVCRLVDEGILSAVADRVMASATGALLTPSDLRTVQASDVEAACRWMNASSKAAEVMRRPIGFKA